MIDLLESRRLLTSSLSNGVLTIISTSGNDSVSVSIVNGKIHVAESGLAAKDYTTSSVTKIIADARSGNDRITISSSITKPCELKGNTGNDTIRGGGGVDALLGGDGDDNLEGGAKNDYLDGGRGWDSIDYSSRSGAIKATLDLESGNNLVSGLKGSGGGSGESDSYAGMETLLGGTGNDTLTLQPIADAGAAPATPVQILLNGGNGNDIVQQAYMYTGGNAEPNYQASLRGGEGNDKLYYAGYFKGTLKFYGDAGDDLIKSNGDEYNSIPAYVEGGGGKDEWGDANAESSSSPVRVFNMGTGLEKLVSYNTNGGLLLINGSEVDNSMLSVGGSRVTVRGNAGNDTMVLSRYDEGGDLLKTSISGGDGNDKISITDYESGGVLFNTGSSDSIDGGKGNDTIDAGRGNDSLKGADGNDSILSGSGNDTLIGGAGNDYLNGGSGNDVLTGDAGNDRMYGGSGNDILLARDSTKDVVDGGLGKDAAQKDLLDVLTSIESVIP